MSEISLFGFGDPIEEPHPLTIQESKDFARLTEKQRRNAAVLSRNLFIDNMRVDAQAVYDLWPYNDPDPDIRLKAGERPNLQALTLFMDTTEYSAAMAAMGVEYADTRSGLTPAQSALLTTLGDFTDNKTLAQKLKLHKVSFATYQAWLKQRTFGEFHSKLAGRVLKEAIPAAEVQLAQQMQSGNLAAIKFAFEVSGHHDPASKKQVDAQRLVGLILEAIDSEVKDPETRARIGDRLKILSASAIQM
jgi:hypothetical protein